MKHVRQRARFRQHQDVSCLLSFFLSFFFFFFFVCVVQGNMPKEIHAILIETLRERAPLYATLKNWVAQVKHGDFSTCDVPHPG